VAAQSMLAMRSAQRTRQPLADRLQPSVRSLALRDVGTANIAELAGVPVRSATVQRFEGARNDALDPTALQTLTVRFGPLSEAQFRGLHAAFGGRSEVPYAAHRTYDVVDFLPPVAQALVNVDLEPAAPLTIEGSSHWDDYYRPAGADKSLLVTTNCHSTAYELMRAYQGADREVTLFFGAAPAIEQLTSGPDFEVVSEFDAPEAHALDPGALEPGDVVQFFGANGLLHSTTHVGGGLFVDKPDTESEGYDAPCRLGTLEMVRRPVEVFEGGPARARVVRAREPLAPAKEVFGGYRDDPIVEWEAKHRQPLGCLQAHGSFGLMGASLGLELTALLSRPVSRAPDDRGVLCAPVARGAPPRAAPSAPSPDADPALKPLREALERRMPEGASTLRGLEPSHLDGLRRLSRRIDELNRAYHPLSMSPWTIDAALLDPARGPALLALWAPDCQADLLSADELAKMRKAANAREQQERAGQHHTRGTWLVDHLTRSPYHRRVAKASAADASRLAQSCRALREMLDDLQKKAPADRRAAERLRLVDATRAAIEDIRRANSNTIGKQDLVEAEAAEQARRAHDATLELIPALVDRYPDPMRAQDVLQVVDELHEAATGGQTRTRGPDENAMSGFDAYTLGEDVPEAMRRFAAWFERADLEVAAGRMSPLELAARASQTLASVHPKTDGNGRLVRHFLDVTLLRHGLAPATFCDVGGTGTEEFNLARHQFAGSLNLPYKIPEDALVRVTAAVQRTVSLLTQAARGERPVVLD